MHDRYDLPKFISCCSSLYVFNSWLCCSLALFPSSLRILQSYGALIEKGAKAACGITIIVHICSRREENLFLNASGIVWIFFKAIENEQLSFQCFFLKQQKLCTTTTCVMKAHTGRQKGFYENFSKYIIQRAKTFQNKKLIFENECDQSSWRDHCVPVLPPHCRSTVNQKFL